MGSERLLERVLELDRQARVLDRKIWRTDILDPDEAPHIVLPDVLRALKQVRNECLSGGDCGALPPARPVLDIDAISALVESRLDRMEARGGMMARAARKVRNAWRAYADKSSLAGSVANASAARIEASEHEEPDGYAELLANKFTFGEPGLGWDVDADYVSRWLKPHQRDLVRWACRKGNAAIFAAFGLGKTPMQIEILRLCRERWGGDTLVVAPLGVRGEFLRLAPTLGVQMKFIRRPEEMEPGIHHYVTNYESVRDGKLPPTLFAAASLDEASILRGYGTKTYQEFLPLFKDVAHRFVATATPSPNRYKELIHYGAFLGAMDSGQALTRFFQRDSEKAGNLTLLPHMEGEFFAWLHSWAIFLQAPSDLGYSDEGYALPPIEIRWHTVGSAVGTAVDRDGQALLIDDAALGLSAAARVKRESLAARCAKAAEIVAAEPDEHFILWHTLESERHELARLIPGATSVWGSQDLDEREAAIEAFSNGAARVLSTKPSIAGSGCNFQRHCRREVFVGIDYGFNDFIQAVHRVYRFMQTRPVIIDVILAEGESEIRAELMRKWDDDKRLRARMSALIRRYGLSDAAVVEELKRTVGVEREEAAGTGWRAVHNDCVAETRGMSENSVDAIVTSIPFGNQYEYTPSVNDFGHNADNAAFWRQMDYLTPELRRVLRPGRVACIHVKDRIRFGSVTGWGAPSVEPFHAECIEHFRRHGFIYFGMVTVVTDVVRENNQTYRLGWSEQCKDGTKMGVGMPEYVLLFRKIQSETAKGYADVPVAKSKEEYTRGRWQVDAHALWRSSGDRFLRADELAGYGPDALARVFTDASLSRIYDYREHVRLAEELDKRGRLPCTFMAVAPGSHAADVWHDVTRMRTLNTDQAREGAEKHVCPLQFDIVDRCIERYTNRGETVYDPFGGLMTVPVRALALGRQGIGCELSGDYWRDGVRHLRAAEIAAHSPTLFDLEKLAG